MNNLTYNTNSKSFLSHSAPKQGTSVGQDAGWLNDRGYYMVMAGGRKQRAHRVIWEMFNGKIPDGMVIDHIDGNPLNNSIENLRLATPSQNSYNAKGRSKKSGLPKGMKFQRSGSICCTITKQGEVYCKTFKLLVDAQSWLDSMRASLHGDFKNSGGK